MQNSCSYKNYRSCNSHSWHFYSWFHVGPEHHQIGQVAASIHNHGGSVVVGTHLVQEVAGRSHGTVGPMEPQDTRVVHEDIQEGQEVAWVERGHSTPSNVGLGLVGNSLEEDALEDTLLEVLLTTQLVALGVHQVVVAQQVKHLQDAHIQVVRLLEEVHLQEVHLQVVLLKLKLQQVEAHLLSLLAMAPQMPAHLKAAHCLVVHR